MQLSADEASSASTWSDGRGKLVRLTKKLVGGAMTGAPARSANTQKRYEWDRPQGAPYHGTPSEVSVSVPDAMRVVVELLIDVTVE